MIIMIHKISAIYQQGSLRESNHKEKATPEDLSGLGPKSAEVSEIVSISHAAEKFRSDEKQANGADEKGLSEDEKRQVDQLKQRDQEVKAHEQAHMAAGGGLVQGGASYTYQRGADGKLYAVGGEVKIDTSAERAPDQTIRKMEQVKRAAMAPAQPSAADRAVAARAAQVELQAAVEKIQQNEEDTSIPPASRNSSIDPANSFPYAAAEQETDSMGNKIDIKI